MDDFELIFNMLGERATTEIHRNENSKGIPKLKADAKEGGDIAGRAEESGKRLKRSVVSKKNFLKKPRTNDYRVDEVTVTEPFSWHFFSSLGVSFRLSPLLHSSLV